MSLRPKEEIVERQQTLAIIEARFRQGNGSNSALSRDHFLKRAPCLTRKEGKEDAIESFWVRIYSDKGLLADIFRGVGDKPILS